MVAAVKKAKAIFANHRIVASIDLWVTPPPSFQTHYGSAALTCNVLEVLNATISGETPCV
jgi:hypothetical protein